MMDTNVIRLNTIIVFVAQCIEIQRMHVEVLRMSVAISRAYVRNRWALYLVRKDVHGITRKGHANRNDTNADAWDFIVWPREVIIVIKPCIDF